MARSCTPSPKVTDAEITAAATKLHDTLFQKVVAPSQDQQKDLDIEYTQQSLLLRPQLAVDRAKSICIYLEPHVLDPLLDLTVGEGAGKIMLNANDPSTIGKLWDAQLRMWIIDDVESAIARANAHYADSDTAGGQPVLDVLHVPVKQLLAISDPLFTPPATASELQSSAQRAGSNPAGSFGYGACQQRDV